MTCANDLALSCPDNTVMDIMYANYGRTSSSLCPADSSELLYTNCYIKGSAIMDFINTCENGNDCSGRFSTDQLMSYPQCLGTTPYLETAHQCKLSHIQDINDASNTNAIFLRKNDSLRNYKTNCMTLISQTFKLPATTSFHCTRFN